LIRYHLNKMEKKYLTIQTLCGELELPVPNMNFSTYEQSSKALIKFKNKVRMQRRKLAKKYHPDVGGSKEKMQRINELCDFVKTLQARPPRPRKIIIRYQYCGGMSYTSNTTHASTAFTTW